MRRNQIIKERSDQLFDEGPPNKKLNRSFGEHENKEETKSSSFKKDI